MFDWSIRFEDAELAKRIARAAVDQLGPNDLAAVVFSSAFANNGTPQNFTADRGRLLAAIDRPFALALHNPPVGPGHDPRNGNEVMIDDPEGYESGDCLCRVCVADTIARVANAVRDVQGRRKTLLFIGTYFRSYEALQGPVNRPTPGPPAAITGVVRPSVNTMACSSYLKDARQKMERATSLANLTIHTLDPVGIETALNSPMGGALDGMRVRQDDLAVLADMTGGRTVMNTEAPEALLPAVFGESHWYYLLAFAPADPRATGKFHKVDVKVGRPDVSVRTRSGYYAGETRAADRATSVSPETAAALEGVLPRNDVPLTVSAAPFAVPGATDSAVAVVLGVQQPQPPDGAEPPREGAGCRVRSKRTVGPIRNADGGHHLEAGCVREDAVRIVSRLSLKPGRYEVRLALDAAPNQRASVYTYVDVPNFDKEPLSLSGLVLDATPAVLSAPRNAFADLLPVNMTAARRFARGDRVRAFLRVNQAAGKPAEQTTMTASITDTSGQVVLNEVTTLAPEKFAAGRGADYRVDLPLNRLASGEYLVTVEAAKGQLIARRGVRVAVE